MDPTCMQMPSYVWSALICHIASHNVHSWIWLTYTFLCQHSSNCSLGMNQGIICCHQTWSWFHLWLTFIQSGIRWYYFCDWANTSSSRLQSHICTCRRSDCGQLLQLSKDNKGRLHVQSRSKDSNHSKQSIMYVGIDVTPKKKSTSKLFFLQTVDHEDILCSL